MTHPAQLRERAAALRAQLPPRRTPPPHTGELLASLPRKDGVELRLVWDRYENKPYLSLRLWRDGFPTKDGLTVRVHELAAVADGLALALERAASETKAGR